LLPTEFPDDFHIGNFLLGENGRAAIHQQIPRRTFSPIRNDNAFGWRSFIHYSTQRYASSILRLFETGARVLLSALALLRTRKRKTKN
jgi:hypothetical protein